MHTHYARYQEGAPAIAYAEEHGWMPELNGEITPWEHIPQLAADYEAGRVDTYFPVFSINPV